MFSHTGLYGRILLVITGFSVILSAQQTRFSGVVFNDLNKNTIRDKGEEGIPGVAVSNQKDVVLTTEDGRFEITADDETIIFLSKPSGYQTHLNSQQLPQFFHIHQPQGSPPQKFSGLKPDASEVKTLDFPLYKIPETDTFDVVVFSDPQPASKDEIDYIRDDVIAELASGKAIFGITLGDIMYDDLSLFPYYNTVVSQLGIPFYNVPGNHDTNQDAANDRYSLETFKSIFGPPYYSFNYGQVHFVVLDNIDWRGPDRKYRGLIGGRQLTWLENDLEYVDKDKLVVLLMHIPIYTMHGDGGNVNITDRKPMFELLQDRSRVFALAGHMHMIEHQFIDASLGWEGKTPLHLLTCAAVSGSWWNGPEDERGIPVADQRDGVPNGYHMVSFKGNTYTESFKAAGNDRRYQIRISLPAGPVPADSTKGLKIVANIFNGNSRSHVEFSIDNGAYIKMKPSMQTDPYIVDLIRMHREKYQDWINAEPSNHIWTAEINKELQPGVHRLLVRTRDMYGVEYSAMKIFEVL